MSAIINLSEYTFCYQLSTDETPMPRKYLLSGGCLKRLKKRYHHPELKTNVLGLTTIYQQMDL